MTPLSPDLVRKMHALWRAANCLSVGQICLRANPLLEAPQTLAHIKGRFSTLDPEAVPRQTLVSTMLRVALPFSASAASPSSPPPSPARSTCVIARLSIPPWLRLAPTSPPADTWSSLPQRTWLARKPWHGWTNRPPRRPVRAKLNHTDHIGHGSPP